MNTAGRLQRACLRVNAARVQGIKISAQNLENAVAGTQLYVLQPGDDEDEVKELVMTDMSDIFDKKEPEGVCVQASTLGSLEALLEFLGSDAVRAPRDTRSSADGLASARANDAIRLLATCLCVSRRCVAGAHAGACVPPELGARVRSRLAQPPS